MRRKSAVKLGGVGLIVQCLVVKFHFKKEKDIASQKSIALILSGTHMKNGTVGSLAAPVSQ